MTSPPPLWSYRAHSFEDLLNTLPTAFGFVPRESLIAIAVSGPHHRFGFRVRIDVPRRRADDDQVVGLVADHVLRNAEEAVILIALTADPAVGEDLLHAVAERVGSLPVRLKLWATDDRLWTDLPDFPPEGEPYEMSPIHEARLTAVAAGHVIVEDRAHLYDEVVPAAGPADRPPPELLAVMSELGRPGGEDRLREELLAALRTEDDRSTRQLVRLGALVVNVRLRDVAWQHITRENAARMHGTWCAVVRVMTEPFAAAPLCLAAFAAWMRGDGARSLVALERALDLRPDYTMARLLFDLVSHGVDPARWADFDTRRPA